MLEGRKRRLLAGQRLRVRPVVCPAMPTQLMTEKPDDMHSNSGSEREVQTDFVNLAKSKQPLRASRPTLSLRSGCVISWVVARRRCPT